MRPTPAHYRRLKPFLDLFATGLPILTYHKLGPRPRRARLKGLYLGTKLFAAQVTELQAAGYRTQSLDAVLQPPVGSRRDIVLTFDDGFQNALQYAVEPLRRCGFRAIQFLVADRLGALNDWEMAEGEVPERLMDEAQVREWLAAGHEIGSHSLTHPWLTRISAVQAREEIAASKRRLEDRFGVPVRHFCYPYGDENEAIGGMVRAAGYVTACTTQSGVNTPAVAPHQLRRFTARYRTRRLRGLIAWLRRQWG